MVFQSFTENKLILFRLQNVIRPLMQLQISIEFGQSRSQHGCFATLGETFYLPYNPINLYRFGGGFCP
jgi:hypothetical protein